MGAESSRIFHGASSHGDSRHCQLHDHDSHRIVSSHTHTHTPASKHTHKHTGQQTHTQAHTHTPASKHTHTHTHRPANTHTHICTEATCRDSATCDLCAFVCVCVYVCVCMCVCVCVCKRKQIELLYLTGTTQMQNKTDNGNKSEKHFVPAAAPVNLILCENL